MSDHPRGPDWWQASDGMWYPPQGPTAPQPQTYWPSEPPPQPKSKGPLIAILVALAAVAAAVVGFIIVAGGTDEEAADEATTTTEAGEADESTTTAEEGDGELGIDVPDGFVAVVNEDEGFAIALPDEWEEFDLSDPAVQDALDEFGENNPEMGDVIDAAGGIIASGGMLFALDPTRIAFAPNVNIIKSPGEANPLVLESVVPGQLEAIGARNISTDIVDLPAGEALAMEYDLTVNRPDGSPLDVHGVQFQVPAAGSTWAVAFSTDDIGRDGDLVDQMIESFTVAG